MAISDLSKQNYSTIHSFDLLPGMMLECDVFYKQGDKYIKLIGQTVLDKVSFVKLQKMEMNHRLLYVKAEDLGRLIECITEARELAATVDSFKTEAYSKVKEQANDVLNEAFKKKTVNKKQTDTISLDIKDAVVTFTTGDILSNVNSFNPANEYLYNHSLHVAFLNGLIGKWLHLSEEQIGKLVKIGFLHDVGKTKIPLQILDKPGALTEDEFKIMKYHPIFSYNMLIESGETDTEILTAVRAHHEKTNGTGYPDALSYSQIPLYARITTISDIYDAMISRRVYKPLSSPFEVLEEFANGKFSNLDTSISNLFLENMPIELTGKRVLLSNGKIGKISFISPTDFKYPLVETEGEIIKTNETLKCVTLYEI